MMKKATLLILSALREEELVGDSPTTPIPMHDQSYTIRVASYNKNLANAKGKKNSLNFSTSYIFLFMEVLNDLEGVERIASMYL